MAFPCVGDDGALDHIPFASILEPQFRASCFSTTLDQLSVKKVFGDAACVHSSHVVEPSEASLCQECVEAARVGLFQYLRIGDPILPLDLENASKSSHMDAIELIFLPCIGSPGHAIEQSHEYAGIVDAQSGPLCEVRVAPHSLLKLGHDCGCPGNPVVDL